MSENKWTAFSEQMPKTGDRIIMAQIGPVERCTGEKLPNEIICLSPPITVREDHRSGGCWDHWCYASVLPPVPAKRDYCREAWEKLGKMPEDFKDSHKDFRFVPLSGNGVAFTLNEFRSVWKMAIACAKENGLEKV